MRNDLKKILIIIFSIFLVVVVLLPDKKNDINFATEYIKNPRSITKKENFKIGIPKRDNLLNPLNDGGFSPSLVSKLVHASLFEKDEHNNYIKDIVDEYWYDNQGKTISMTLKRGYYFDDGTEITANHVKNTYMLLANHAYTGNYSEFVDNIEGYYPYKLQQKEDLTGIEVVESHYIKFHFNITDFGNISKLTFPILDIEEVNESRIDEYYNKQYKNGAGIYEISQEGDDFVNLSLKNQDNLENIKVKNINIQTLDMNNAVHVFREGQLDILYKFPKNTQIADQIDDRIKEYSYTVDNESQYYNYLGFNQKSEIFSKEKYRRALRDDIDIERILDETYGENVYSYPKLPIYSNSWFYDNGFELTESDSLEKVIAEDIKNKEMDKSVFNIKLIALDNDNFFKSIEDKFVEQIESEHIKVEVEYLNTHDMYEALNGEKEFDIFVSKKQMTDMPSVVLEDRYPVEGVYKLSSLIEQSFHYILSIIREDTSDQILVNAVNDWKKSFDAIAPYIVLASENETSIVNDRVTGIHFNEFVGFDYIKNLENISIKEE